MTEALRTINGRVSWVEISLAKISLAKISMAKPSSLLPKAPGFGQGNSHGFWPHEHPAGLPNASGLLHEEDAPRRSQRGGLWPFRGPALQRLRGVSSLR